MGSIKAIPLGLRIIGFFKLITATLLTCISFGAFRLMGENAGETLEHFILQLHLDPERHWINLALTSIAGVDPARLKVISAATLCYATLYIIEGIGLLRGKHWAEYMVVIITGSLLPFEMYEVAMKASTPRIAIMLVNITMLIYLIRQLRRDRRHHLESSVSD